MAMAQGARAHGRLDGKRQMGFGTAPTPAVGVLYAVT